jgi:hypothetical protein
MLGISCVSLEFRSFFVSVWSGKQNMNSLIHLLEYVGSEIVYSCWSIALEPRSCINWIGPHLIILIMLTYVYDTIEIKLNAPLYSTNLWWLLYICEDITRRYLEFKYELQLYCIFKYWLMILVVSHKATNVIIVQHSGYNNEQHTWWFYLMAVPLQCVNYK